MIILIMGNFYNDNMTISNHPASNTLFRRFKHLSLAPSKTGEDSFDLNFEDMKKVSKSLQVIKEAIRFFEFENIIVSFNGGKDSTVVLFLYILALLDINLYPNCKPIVVNFFEDGDFIEMSQFVSTISTEWHLSYTLMNGPFTHMIDEYLQSFKNDAKRAFIMGTRQGDPGDENQYFNPSSSWLPPFFRVNPILHWDYSLVWKFLLSLKVPYCFLYDMGYTSIGLLYDTLPNPFLKNDDDSYQPAYNLIDTKEERSGRTKKSSSNLDIKELNLLHIEKQAKIFRDKFSTYKEVLPKKNHFNTTTS